MSTVSFEALLPLTATTYLDQWPEAFAALAVLDGRFEHWSLIDSHGKRKARRAVSGHAEIIELVTRAAERHVNGSEARRPVALSGVLRPASGPAFEFGLRVKKQDDVAPVARERSATFGGSPLTAYAGGCDGIVEWLAPTLAAFERGTLAAHAPARPSRGPTRFFHGSRPPVGPFGLTDIGEVTFVRGFGSMVDELRERLAAIAPVVQARIAARDEPAGFTLVLPRGGLEGLPEEHGRQLLEALWPVIDLEHRRPEGFLDVPL